MKKDLRGVNTNISYFTLRKIIGWCGLLLPWTAWLIAWSYENSISDYYYTRSGVLFTSVLTLIGVFLIAYRGYEQEDERFSDNLLTWIGGILLIAVAAVPTPYSADALSTCPTPICHNSTGWGTVHFGSAVGFFIVMGYLSIFHFSRGKKPFSPNKVIRNRIYRTCGYGMWATLAVAGILIFVFGMKKHCPHIILWVEVIMLVLFGISWLVKGKALVDLGIQKDD